MVSGGISVGGLGSLAGGIGARIGDTAGLMFWGRAFSGVGSCATAAEDALSLSDVAVGGGATSPPNISSIDRISVELTGVAGSSGGAGSLPISSAAYSWSLKQK